MNSKSLVDTSRIVPRESSLELGWTYVHVFFHADHEYCSAINWFWEEHGGTWWQSGQNRQRVESSISKSMTTVQSYFSGFYIKNGLTNVALASLENIFRRTWFWALKSFWDRQVPLILHHYLTQSIPQRFSGRGIRIWPQRRSIPSGRPWIWRSKNFFGPILVEMRPSCSSWKFSAVWCLTCANFQFIERRTRRNTWVAKVLWKNAGVLPTNSIKEHDIFKILFILKFHCFYRSWKKETAGCESSQQRAIDYNNTIPCFRRSSLSNGRLPQSGVC